MCPITLEGRYFGVDILLNLAFLSECAWGGVAGTLHESLGMLSSCYSVAVGVGMVATSGEGPKQVLSAS